MPRPELFGIYVLICAIAFPLLNSIVRSAQRKRVTRGSVVEKIVLGVSAPTFLFLALSPLDPALLTKISDQQFILCMTGVIGLALCIFSLLEDES